MTPMSSWPRRSLPRMRQRGATLIEILVTLVILMVGLLGLVGVMVQSQRAQLESYQRVQALALVQDMAARISSNKAAATCYELASFIGTGNETVPDAAACAAGSAEQKARVTQDLTDWRDLLLGAAELSGSDKVGAVLGARGCITKTTMPILGASGLPGTPTTTDFYQISVAWQNSAPTAAPPSGVPCAQGQYGADDAARGAVSVAVQIGT